MASSDYWGDPGLLQGLTQRERIRAVLHAVAYIDVHPDLFDAEWYDEMSARIDMTLRTRGRPVAASRDDIARWYDARPEGAMHMIVMTDTFTYDDYPVYVRVDQDAPEDAGLQGWPVVARTAQAVVAKLDGDNMQKMMEVYKYAMDRNEQLATRRVLNY